MDLQKLFNDAETAITNYNNDTVVVALDQQKIKDAQDKLAADQVTTDTDGATAYTAVGALIAAFQVVQATLPAPKPVN